MFKVLLYLIVVCYSFIGYLYGQEGCPQNAQELVMFTEWNTKTIESLENQLKISMKDTQYARRIALRVDALKSYLSIKNASELNRESIRFKFLSLLRQESLLSGDFCLVEIRSGGERVLIKNLVVEKLGRDSVKIVEFEYAKEMWKKVEERKEAKWGLQFPLSLERLPFGKGKNPDDLIITLFRKFKILESEYFIHGTFSKYEIVRNVVE